MSARKSVQDVENTGGAATETGADCRERATEASEEVIDRDERWRDGGDGRHRRIFGESDRKHETL